MLNSLKKIFQQPEDKKDDSIDELYLLCGLMVEAANIDGNIDNKEIIKINNILINRFKEDPGAVKIEIEKCLNELDDNKSLHFFTSRINKTFSEDKKITLIEILWEIILADGEVHDFESNLVRRLAGLLYISDFVCGKARKKALENIQING